MKTGQQKALHNVGHMAEGQRVAATANDDAFAGLHLLGHASKVQVITGAKEGAGAQDYRFHIAGEHQATNAAITLGLRQAIGVGIRPQRIVLGQVATMP